MNPINMTALRPCVFAGKRLKAGDEFVASPRDSKVCIAARIALPTPPKPAKPEPKVAKVRAVEPQVQTAELTAESDETTEPEITGGEDKPKRTYKRRDLKAEE